MASRSNKLTRGTDRRLAKHKRLTPQQAAYLTAYFDPQSPTYANSYKSALSAGFEEQYALNLRGQSPKWLSEFINNVLPDDNEIITKINRETEYGLHQGERNTAMAAQTRLKALELLGKTKRTPVFENPRDNLTLNRIDHITITLGSETPPKPLGDVIEGEVLPDSPPA